MRKSRLSALAILSTESDFVEMLSFEDIILKFVSIKLDVFNFELLIRIKLSLLFLYCVELHKYILRFDGVKGWQFVQKSKGGRLRCYATVSMDNALLYFKRNYPFKMCELSSSQNFFLKKQPLLEFRKEVSKGKWSINVFVLAMLIFCYVREGTNLILYI